MLLRSLAGIALLLALAPPVAFAQAPPPSFLIIDLDDARVDGVDQMPTLLARVAAEGIVFENAFTPHPVCASSRASLLTGLHSSSHGVRSTTLPLGSAVRFRERGGDRHTLGTLMQPHGYRTGYFGKYLNGYQEGSEGQRGPGGTLYVPPGWERWWVFASGDHYGGIHGPSYQVATEDGTILDFDDHTSDAQYSTDLSAQEARAFIAQAATDGDPFLVVWAPYAPHIDAPDVVPVPADRHLGAFMGLTPWRPPSYDEADVSDKPRWVAHRSPDLNGDGSHTDAMREGAYEALLSVDEQIGLFLDQLVALGLDEDTVVLVTSDNGVNWGEHRGFNQSKLCPYEECLRVPFMVRYPRVAAPGVVSAPVLNLDVYPTVAALAGVAAPAVDGESFDGWLAGSPPAGWRSDFRIESWRSPLQGKLSYTGSPQDGDQLRLFHGEWDGSPRDELLLEFDDGGGAGAGAIAVPLGASDDETFGNLGLFALTALPAPMPVLSFGGGLLALTQYGASPPHGPYWWEETDTGGVIDPEYPRPTFLGVRDTAGGYLWVEYETGERELYDLVADPDQLQNRVDDPAYASIQATLAARLAALRPAPLLPVCSDGEDNDEDGLTDWPADPGCLSADAANEAPRCDDGVDNNGDGKIDWDGAGVGPPDWGCIGWPFADQEKKKPKPGCGLGPEAALIGLLARMRRRRLGARRRPEGGAAAR